MRRRKNKEFKSAHKRLVLEFMGINIREQPKAINEINALLYSFEEQQPEEYERAYNIIVHKDFGNEDEEIQKVVDIKDVTSLMSTVVDGLEESAVVNLAKSFEGKSEKLIEAIKHEKDFFFDSIAAKIEKESKKFNRIEVKVGKQKPVPIDDILPEEFETLLQLASSRINILMVGPTGCGKTHVAELIAKALNLAFSSQSCSAGVSESSFRGWLIPIGDGGKFVYVSSEFVRIYEKGGVFLFDEMDAADSNMLIFLNQAIGNKGFVIPERSEKPYVKKHKNFVAVAATNTNGSGADILYNGRNALDEATLDRFRIGTVQMDYSPHVESSLIKSSILEWGLAIRAEIKKHSLNRVMSTRTMLDAQTMMETHKWDSNKVEAGYFSSWTEEEVRMIKRGKEHRRKWWKEDGQDQTVAA